MLALGVACGDDDGNPGVDMGADTSDGGGNDTALVRLWHLAPDAGNVDVFIDGDTAQADVAFEGNTNYLEVPAGARALAVSAAGAGVDAAVLTGNATLAAGSRQTVAVIQTNADANADGAFDFVIIDESAEVPADQIGFHIFHASFAVPNPVRVFDTAAPDASLAELAQGQASSLLTVPNAAYTFGLDVSDPLDDAIDLQMAMPLDMPPAGARVTLGVLSKPEGDEVETEVVFIVNEGVHDEIELEEVGSQPAAQVRLWHLAPAAGNVDVFVDGAAAQSDFAFEANTNYLEVPAGEHALAVSAAGAGVDAAVLSGMATLAPNSRQTVAVIQTLEDPMAADAFSFVIIDETAAITAGNIGFHVFHASFAVPNPVRVFNTAAPETSLGEVAQGAVLPLLDVPNGAYTFGLDVSDPLDDVIDLQMAMGLDMPPADARITAGVLSKPEGDGIETELVFIVNEGVHEEVAFEPAE